MRKIKLGRTQSYGEIAAAIGNSKAMRAVGSACGANPIPLLVPCHRVLAAQQKIGGFSGGLAWKRKLLALEKISVAQSVPAASALAFRNFCFFITSSMAMPPMTPNAAMITYQNNQPCCSLVASRTRPVRKSEMAPP